MPRFYASSVATMFSAGPSGRLLAAVERVCTSTLGCRELRAAIIDLLGREMPVDAFAFVLTDPETSVGVDPLASIPDLRELPLVIALKYTTPTHRWTTLDDVASLASTPVGARGPWHEYVLARGVVDVASMVLRDRYGCWGFIDLWSTSSLYADRDLTLLRDLNVMLTAAVRGRQALTFAASAGDGAGHGDTAEEGPAVVLLDASPDRGLVITGNTPGTKAWLTRLLPPDSRRAPVPAAVLNVAAQLLAREADVDDSPALGRVHVGGAVWLRLRASRLDPSGQIAVTIELASPADRVEVFARAHGLSPRERELLDVLADGVDTADAAARLFITPNTVQDHVKSVFAKAGVHSRRELLGRVLGVSSTPA
jgi:DNA-binding CsgD family transcriptional regulator